MLQAAQQAEDNLHTSQPVAQEAVDLSHAFYASSSGGLPLAAGAFPSQAEKTLARYQPSGGYPADGSPATASGNLGTWTLPWTWSCFCSGDPHLYLEFHQNKGHIVICPNRDNPGVGENANRNTEKMQKNWKEHHIQNTKSKNLRLENLSDFNKSGQQQIQEQVLQSMARQEVSNCMSVASLVTTPSSIT